MENFEIEHQKYVQYLKDEQFFQKAEDKVKAVLTSDPEVEPYGYMKAVRYGVK